MSDNQSLFQQKALEKLRQPADTTQLLAIVPSVGWVALSAVLVIIFSALIWSIFGIMAEKVEGFGIIVNTNGATTITPLRGGRIQNLNLKIGDTVSEGQSVATISQPDLEREFYSDYNQSMNTQSEQERQSLAAKMAVLRDQLHDEMQVPSPHDGVVINVRHREGDLVQAGEPLYDIRITNEAAGSLQAVIFIPALKGNRLKLGDTVQVSPGSIDQEEFGALVGRVVAISDYPVTSDRVRYWTGNSEFASWVVQSNGGAVMEAIVELIPDPATKSGYLWTSVRGATDTIVSGMTCTATAITRRKAPLVKAFDRLGQWLRND
ncbi:MAG: efflux RND transporter periplasmic adaptor subunit [Schwartzia sp.]|nr:efflux RND transporter periplasmic adaptor subunit [Schwartzia sp. (in: firmicutes)]